MTIAETALNAAISLGITAAIMFAIKGFDKLANSAKKASEAADKAFSETDEKVQKNEEESKSLDELVSRYKELKESESLDVDGRKEIKNIQNDIADLVGVQASNLDLVNGKLDDEIAKLNKISEKEAKKAYETATANYNNSKKSVDSAVGDDSLLFMDGYAYVGKREKEAEKILSNAGFKKGITLNTGGSFNNTLIIDDTLDSSGKELKGAQEKSDYLQSMIDVLEQNGQRATDLYSGLISQRDKYLEYVNNQQDAANSLVNSWISYSQFSNDELSKINVDSLDSFEEYRQKMIDEAKSDETIGQMLADGILSDKDLENAINNFFATSTKFSTWYEKWIDSIQGSTNTNGKSFNADIDTLTKKIDEIQNVYKTLKDAIKEYNKEGYISVDTFQSIIGLGADYLKYLVDEDGNLKLNAQSLQELTIARVKDMVVAQKNKILETADGWSTEADAAKYLKANLDETSDSYDDLIEKRLQLLRIKWTEQLDENGNRVWTDEQIENTIAGLRKQFGSLDTVQNAAIKGIQSGFGMTGESAKDNADKIKDINKQLDDLAKSEALQKLKYKFDQLEQGITKIDTALSLLNSISDLTYEDDYIGKIEIVSNQLDLATSKAQLLQNEFEQLSAEQHDTADSSNELASRMKSTADSIAENQKQIIEYGKNITSYYMSALSAINSLSKKYIENKL